MIIILSVLVSLTGCKSYAKDFEQVGPNEKIIIRFSHVVGEDTPKGQAARQFAQLIKERTNGKMEVQVFANGSLYKDGEEWDALQNGKIQMIAPALSKMTSKIPELEIFDLPFFFTNLDQIHQLTDGKIGNEIFETAKKSKMEPLAIWDNGFKQFTNNKRPIHTPEDFDGLTFRIMPSPLLQEQFNMVGANAEAINFNDIYQSIIKHKIDGEENTVSNIYTKRFYEVQKYMTISDHGYLGYLVMINKDFWDKLSPENQQIIKTTMADVTDWQREKAKEIQEQQLKAIEKSDSTFINTLSTEQWKRFSEKYLPLQKKYEQKYGFILGVK